MKIKIDTSNKLRRMSKQFLKNRVFICDRDVGEGPVRARNFRRRDVYRVFGAIMMAYPDEVLKFFAEAGIEVHGESEAEAEHDEA